MARAEPQNEPVLSYAPRTRERAELVAELERQTATPCNVPLFIDGAALHTPESRLIRCPHRHELVLGSHSLAGDAEVERAIVTAMEARASWSSWELDARAAVFLRAAELLSGKRRQWLNAKTMLNQSKTAHQAEIDAACELIDFFRFNVHFADQLTELQPRSARDEQNRLELRPLDGFVYAVTPFNFTSIAGNLPTAPALLGNTVVWKPSPHAVLSAHAVLELLHEAGLPPGVINLVLGDAEAITRRVLAHPDFAGLHFTGSTRVLHELWYTMARHLRTYRSLPRIVAETGGKDFVVAHGSADIAALAVAIVRGAYEYQGQKCSAVSRVYVARSLWPALKARLIPLIEQLSVGDPADFQHFMGAVISREAFDRIRSYQALASQDPAVEVLAGGGANDTRGYFVSPTLVEVRDPRHRLMQEEIFGPLASVFVYDDERYDDLLALVDHTSPYALTGAIFARDRRAVELASQALRHAAGNFYVNDKPTGAVVGQQPFGGSRWSGTNDKAGSVLNLVRWTSPRTIKENFNPPLEYRYPFMDRE